MLEVQQQGAKGGLYQCDLKLAKVENQFVQGVFRGKLNPYVMHDSKALGKKYSILPEKRSPLPSSIYPVNALRGAAVDIVIEHVTKHQQGAQRQVDVERDNALVFVVDVDMRPSDLLCQALSSSTMADCAATASGSHPHHHLVQALVKACTEEGKFVVFPALEVINAEKHNTDVSDANMLHHAANNIDKLLHATDSKSLHYKMKDLRHGGQIRAFHAASYLAGHMATDTDTWFENVLHPVSPPVLREVSHQEGWEPYGVLSLRTFLRAGGFNRCFVGWHKDKIDFIKRLSAHGVTFAVCEDISAFVLDWQPHAACKDRVRTRVDHLYLAAMQGLYNRSCRQHLALTERSPDEVYSDSRCSGGKENLCSSQNSENSISDESVLNIDSMSVLHDSDCLLMDFWQTVKTIKVCASSLGKENISLDTKSATYRIAMRPGALSPPMGGISFTMQVLRSTEQTSACTALGVRYRVFFPKEFSWKGGGCLPGVSMRAVAEQGMEYECRGRWNDRGLVSFYVKSEAADWEISVDRRVQMHRDSWHSLEIVVHELGQVSANIDGAPLLRGRCSRGVLSIIGARMCVFCNDIDSSANASSHVALKSVTLSVTEEVESRLSAASVRSIIENDVKVIFAPKETHSLSLSALKEFLSLYPIVAHLVLVIAPPLPQRLADELADILAAHCRSVGGPTVFRYSLHNARPFQNPYEVRNEVVHKLSDIRARYTLHINNDVLSDIHSGPYGSVSESPSHSLQRGQWLEELVRYAEENPEQWAVMPLLLEKNSDRWGLHVWWDQTAVSSASLSAEAVCPASHSEAHQEEFNFSAKFNESFLLAAVSDLPALLRNRLAAKPLLFLEDHIVLAQTDKFPASVPLFDPLACYRREFFDLAWQIRVRGGDVGIALNSVVTYVKVQPLQLDDIAYFVHRRQDELCFMSQRYLSHKWRINYRTDRWHAKQLHEALLGARFCKIDDPLSAVRLVLCMLVAAGASRFALTGCEDSGRKLSRNGQSTVDMETMFKLLPDVFSAAQNEAPEKSLALTFAHEESIGHAYETTCPHSNILAQLRGIDTISSADAVVCVKESVPIKLCARFSFFKISWTEDAAEGGDLAGNIGSRQWKSVCTLYPCLGQLFSLLVRYDSQRSGPKVSRPVQVQCEGWVWLTESGADSGGGGAPSSPIVVAEMLEKICCVLSSQQGVLFGANQVNSFDIFRPVDEADGDDDVEGICSTPAEVLLWQYLPFSATSLESLIGHMGL